MKANVIKKISIDITEEDEEIIDKALTLFKDLKKIMDKEYCDMILLTEYGEEINNWSKQDIKDIINKLEEFKLIDEIY